MFRFASLLCLVVYAAFFISFTPTQRHAQAAPAPPTPYCQITGKIIKIEKRKEAYQDEAWRENMGLPKFMTYTDVTVLLETKKPFNLQDAEYSNEFLKKECHFEKAKEEVFQNADGNLSDKWIGLKIWAVTHRGGDEFSYGNWLIRAINASSMAYIGDK